MSIVLDPSQEKAVELVLSEPLGVVTGGPGTGKTTILRTALDRIDERKGTPRVAGPSFYDEEFLTPYELASPTGKAARRMTEATGRPARTIHRLLEYGHEGFARNEGWPLSTELVVIDEASMLDVELAECLLDAVNPATTRVVFVGDVNQLPSVGPGRVFGDLIDSGEIPVARLTTLHRAAQESWICRSAPRVLAGEMPELRACDDFAYCSVESSSDVVPYVVELVAEELPRRPLVTDVQVLAPQNTGPVGTKALNAAIRARVNPPRAGERSWGKGDYELRQRDRVIQTKNDYNIGIFNGECGTILAIGDEGIAVDFDGRAVQYDRSNAGNLRLAYALTIHKSQGSEFDWAVVICHSANHFMLSRQLLYTAITRAKKGVVLVGNEAGLKRAVENAEAAKRNSSLAERLKEVRA